MNWVYTAMPLLHCFDKKIRLTLLQVFGFLPVVIHWPVYNDMIYCNKKDSNWAAQH